MNAGENEWKNISRVSIQETISFNSRLWFMRIQVYLLSGIGVRAHEIYGIRDSLRFLRPQMKLNQLRIKKRNCFCSHQSKA